MTEVTETEVRDGVIVCMSTEMSAGDPLFSSNYRISFYSLDDSHLRPAE
jgi:hypothetical protein